MKDVSQSVLYHHGHLMLFSTSSRQSDPALVTSKQQFSCIRINSLLTSTHLKTQNRG